MSDPVILIPARYASSRYPGKPLIPLKGGDGEKTLIHRSWEAACSVLPKEQIYICTDDDRIIETAHSFGAQTILTSENCANGTERCAEAYATADIDADIVVNFQGDAPLTPTWFVQKLIEAMQANSEIYAATPVVRCDAKTLRSFRNDRKAGRVGGTTVVFGADNQALYFSKEVIPYCDELSLDMQTSVFHHVGVYAFRAEALRRYPSFTLGPLEKMEGLEQLRFLENGMAIKCIEVDTRGRIFWELNNPTDVALIEAELQRTFT